VKVHSTLCPGLLESVYQVVLAKELKSLGPAVKRQVSVPIEYEGIKRVVNGLAEENLGVSASLREPKRNCQQDGDLNSESLRSSP